MKKAIASILFLLGMGILKANIVYVGGPNGMPSIKAALQYARPGDTVLVANGLYKEGNITISKPVYLMGVGLPVLDGEKKFEVLSIRSSHVTVMGFKVQRSGYATMDDPGAIKVYESNEVTIAENVLEDNFFGIYIQYGKHCKVLNNRITAYGIEEQQIGNGIHCWKSDSLQITGNTIVGHRDGIYFEFVTHSVVWRNIAYNNIRYGLHFMFSNDDAYFTNYFHSNGAGVAVMFTKNVVMMNNTFADNWGDAAYGLLLKEISDCLMLGNRFEKNTAGVFMDGTNRLRAEKNVFEANGWGLRIQANCMDNSIVANNFLGNTFDVSTNGSLTLNSFAGNYWDKYEGYDLDRDRIGDVPYHPLSLYSVVVEKKPPAMLLYRSFMVSLLDKSEKMIPGLTPENFIDEKPLMHPLPL